MMVQLPVVQLLHLLWLLLHQQLKLWVLHLLALLRQLCHIWWLCLQQLLPEGAVVPEIWWLILHDW